MTAPGVGGLAKTIRLRIRWLVPAAAAIVAAACVSTRPEPQPSKVQAGFSRVEAARERQAAALRELFARAGVDGSGQLLIVVFKAERRLELWGFSRRRGRLVAVAAYPMLATSGMLGPKRRSWDHQIPEGFYRVAALNPASLYHLSLLVDYPNRSDRLLGDRRDPGDDIFIHGDHVSDGCIAIGDRAIEQVYLAVLDSRAAGHDVPVDIFPCRFSDPGCRALLRRDSEGKTGLASFWGNLAAGFELLERSGIPPRVSVDASGRYVFSQRETAEIASTHRTAATGSSREDLR